MSIDSIRVSQPLNVEDDVMDLEAPEERGLKRPSEDALAEQPQKKAKLEEQVSSLFAGSVVQEAKKKSKFERWASPESNALMQIYPQHVGTEDPYSLIKVEVQVAEGKFVPFQVPKFALFKMSPYFQKVLTQGMLESRTQTMRWIGSGDHPNIHVQAAAQIIQFAHLEANIFQKDQCRSLHQLKEQFSEEFLDILTDMVRLCACYGMEHFAYEITFFITDELVENLEDNFQEYFQWALKDSDHSKVFKSAIFDLADQDQAPEKRQELYPLLFSYFEADYSQCTKEQKCIAQKLIQECFIEILENQESQEEIDEICKCMVFLFPQFDFPEELLEKIVNLPFPPIEIIDSPYSYYVYHFCQCYHTFFDRFANFNNTSPPRMEISLEAFDKKRPAPEGVLDIYDTMIRAMLFPKESRIKLLTDFLAQNPNYAFALKFRAWAYFRESQYDAANQDLDAAIRLQPDAVAFQGRALCRQRRRDLQGAVQDIEQAIKLQPDCTANILTKAKLLFSDRKFEASLLEIESLLQNLDLSGRKLSPFEFAAAYLIRGKCYAALQNYSSSMKAFNQALLHDPNHLESLVSMGKWCFIEKKFEEAFKYFDRAIQIQPRYAEALTYRGACYQNRRELDKADSDYKSAIEVNPNYLLVRVYQADLFRERGDPETAIKMLNSLPVQNDLLSLVIKGNCLRVMKQFDEAIVAFNRVCELDPNNLDPIFRRSECYEKKGMFEEALKDLERVEELDFRCLLREKIQARRAEILKIKDRK